MNLPPKMRRAVSLGASAGVLLFFTLFLTGVYSLQQLQGNPDPDAAQVMERFAPKIYLTLARICLVHLWTGAVLGAVSGVAVRALYPSLIERKRWFSVAVFAVLGLVGAYLTARLLVRQPTFFDGFLFAQGGAARRLQIFLTDDVGLLGLNIAGGLLAALVLIGSPSVRSWSPRRLPPTRGQLFGMSVLLVIGVTATLRTFWSPPKPERPDRPNILLISVDSLRPDHLSFQGYERPTSPNIDALAEDARVFDQAYVPIARTLSSWASLLTSTDPHTHGLRHMFPAADRQRMSVPAFAEVLSDYGYRSGVVSDFAGEMFDLIDFGYDQIDTPPASDVNVLVERQMLLHFPHVFPYINHPLGKKVLPVVKYLTINSDAETLADRALRRMRELSDDGPFFMTVFFSTAHAPYATPYPDYNRFTRRDYDGEHRYAYGIRDPRQFLEGALELSPEDREQIIALYDGAIAHVDAAIGKMLDELESWGFDESTIVIVTSDHGEHLFECSSDADHGKWFRGGDSANHIPLIVRDPTGELGAGAVKEMVRSTDLAPTLLGRLGLPIPQSFEGRDLFAALRDGKPLDTLPGGDVDFFGETGVWLKAPTTFAAEPDAMIYPHINDMLDAAPWDETLYVAPPWDEQVVRAKHRMIHDGKHKLVYEPTLTGARYNLYDTQWDPLNATNLATTPGDPRLITLRARLFDWIARDPTRRLDARGHWITHYTERE